MLGISEPRAYDLTKREGFPAIRVSERRIIIPVDALNRWLSEAGNMGRGYCGGTQNVCKINHWICSLSYDAGIVKIAVLRSRHECG